jgi:hypothetical protein
MTHICANDEYRSQYLSLVYLYVFEFESSRRFQFSFTDFSLVCRSVFAQIFPRSQPIRESNTSTYHKNILEILLSEQNFLIFENNCHQQSSFTRFK